MIFRLGMKSRVMERCNRTKGTRLSVLGLSIGRNSEKLVPSYFVLYPLVFAPLPLGTEKACLTRRFENLLRRKFRKPFICHFPNPSTGNIQYATVPYFESVSWTLSLQRITFILVSHWNSFYLHENTAQLNSFNVFFGLTLEERFENNLV